MSKEMFTLLCLWFLYTVVVQAVRSRVIVNAAVHMVVVKAGRRLCGGLSGFPSHVHGSVTTWFDLFGVKPARSLLLVKRSVLVVRHARRSFGGLSSCPSHVQGSVTTC